MRPFGNSLFEIGLKIVRVLAFPCHVNEPRRKAYERHGNWIKQEECRYRSSEEQGFQLLRIKKLLFMLHDSSQESKKYS